MEYEHDYFVFELVNWLQIKGNYVEELVEVIPKIMAAAQLSKSIIKGSEPYDVHKFYIRLLETCLKCMEYAKLPYEVIRIIINNYILSIHATFEWEFKSNKLLLDYIQFVPDQH